MNTKSRFVFFSAILSFLLVSCATAPRPEVLQASPATASPSPVEVKRPVSLVIGKDGRIYFTDIDRCQVMRMDDMDGKGLIAFGHPGYGGQGAFRHLEGDMVMDSKERIYVVDSRAAKLVRFDNMEGSNWTELDLVALGLPVPYALGIDSMDRLYIGDDYRGRMVRIDSMAGDGLVSFGEKGQGQGQFSSLIAIAIDSQGRILVSDTTRHCIIRFDDMAGTNWVSYDGSDAEGKDALVEPRHISIAPDGSLYLADATTARIYHFKDFSALGREVWGWDGSGGRPWQAIGLGLDAAGRIYFADNQLGRIGRIDDLTGKGLIFYPGGGR